MNQLVEIFQKYSLDKLMNKYDKVYVDLLDTKKDIIKNVLEIGIGTIDKEKDSSMYVYKQNDAPQYTYGNSLRAWRDFFVNANIVGVDVDENTMFEEERIKTFCSSSFDKKTMNKILSGLDKFDLIIDDGLHTMEANLRTLEIVFPYLKDGGMYVIEDVNQHDDWYIDELLKDDRFTKTIKGCKFNVYDGFNEKFTRLIVINK
jgi:hypothetical protein